MKKQTVVEKLKHAGNPLGVSFRDLEKELIHLYYSQDFAGMRELFESYRNWELKMSDGTKTPAEIENLARENLDFVCKVADTRRLRGEGHETDQAVLEAVLLPVVSEVRQFEVRQFYRDAIGYHPADPSSN